MPDIYDALLTGDTDGRSDFIYKLKRFNGTLYSGLTSNLIFQLPRINGDVDALTDRPNGEILLRKNGFELYRGAQSNYDFYDGPQNRTFSISASYFAEETIHNSIELPVQTIGNDYDGKRRFRIPGNHEFKPLDYLVHESESIQIDQVGVFISIDGNYMMLREL